MPDHPDDERLRGESLRNGRRPADVWLAHWKNGRSGAVDFAVTSGLRNDMISMAAQDPSTVWGNYEDFKRQYLQTQASCNERNMEFLRFVVESREVRCECFIAVFVDFVESTYGKRIKGSRHASLLNV